MTNQTTTQNGTTKPVEATVQVLTAEVRTLMVGSRQVTLSVFGQLDWVKSDPAHITPMGRINYRGHGMSARALIGADPTGILVRSEYPYWPGILGVELCERNEVGEIVQQENGESVLWHDGAAFIIHQVVSPDYCPDPFAAELPAHIEFGHPRNGEYLPWRQAKQDEFYALRAEKLRSHREQAHWTADELSQRWIGYSRALEWWGQAEALPLIVLAGLR